MWKLLSYEVEPVATGQREFTPNMGKSPTGNLLFTVNGRMMVVITGEGRKPAMTDQDKVWLYGSLVAYAGTYRVEGNQWFTKVEVSANPAWVGGGQARSLRWIATGCRNRRHRCSGHCIPKRESYGSS